MNLVAIFPDLEILFVIFNQFFKVAAAGQGDIRFELMAFKTSHASLCL